MAFILFSDSLFNTTYNLLHTTDILHEQISDLSLLFSIMLFIIDELVKGINIREVVVNYEGIAVIETMAPMLESETVKCWLLSLCSKCSIYEWYMSVKKLRSVNWFWCVDLETEKIQVISNCSIYER